MKKKLVIYKCYSIKYVPKMLQSICLQIIYKQDLGLNNL